MRIKELDVATIALGPTGNVTTTLYKVFSTISNESSVRRTVLNF